MKYLRVEFMGKDISTGIPQVDIRLVDGTEDDVCPKCKKLFGEHAFEGSSTELRRLCDISTEEENPVNDQ